MVSPHVSIWLVTILGWLAVAALILVALFIVLDGLVRLFGVIGWMMATYRALETNPDWKEGQEPAWMKALRLSPPFKWRLKFWKR